MKRECDSPDLQEQSGLGKDCRSTRRKFHRLELNNGKGWLTCFGRVLYKGSKSYSITLDIRPGASMLVSTIMVFDGFNLEAGDHVEVSYTLETSANGDCAITVKELYPEFHGGVGRISRVTPDALFINHHTIVHADTVNDLTVYPVDALVNYRAIRNECGYKWQYRCFSIEPLSVERQKEIMPDFNGAIEQLASLGANKRGIIVDNKDVTFNFLDTALETDEKQTRCVQVGNVSMKAQKLLNVSINADDVAGRVDQFKLLEPDFSAGPITIPSHGSVTLVIEASLKQLGITHEYLMLYLEHNTVMLRNLRIVAGNRKFVQSYDSSIVVRDRRENPLRTFESFTRTWAGPMTISKPTVGRKKIAEREWAAPRSIVEFLRLDDWTRPFMANFEYMFARLTPLNYTEQLHNYLWFDEINLFKVFQDLNQVYIRLREEPGRCLYSVPGSFSESRPSILNGDRFYCDHPQKGLHFDGLVVEVQQDKALLLMNPDFDRHAHLYYDIGFKFARNPYRIQHDAIEKMEDGSPLQSFIFPTREGLAKQPAALNVHLRETGVVEIIEPGEKSRPIAFVRPDLNIIQKRTICNILRGEYRTHPYLIDGPPGTGKTTTLVEIIQLVTSLISDSFVLVCTQSNSAADLILAKLVESGMVQEGDLLRIIAKQYYKQRDAISDELKPYCSALFEEEKAGEEGETVIQGSVSLATLLRTKILIMTSSTTGSLRCIDFPTDHFTHLIVDEAGQCFEGESLIAMQFMEHDRSQVILAGDVKQLGPVTRCKILEECGFKLSLFERLMAIPGLYVASDATEAPPVPELYSKLLLNYRCMPSILQLFNELFYQGQLRPMVHAGQMHSLILRLLQTRLPRLPQLASDHGVYFLSVIGENRKAAGSASWHNEIEAETVLQVYKSISGVGISANDVVVITPYQGQVRYIRQLMEHRGVVKCPVGSVEEFQGQEKAIVILSTVRSTRSLVDFDEKYNLGFLANPKRTNVAISRAQVLLIIIGNGPILNQDGLWSQIIDYCSHRSAYVDMQQQLRENFQ